MNYKFPRIEHIRNVVPYIRDDPNFIIVEKDGYTVINYVVADSTTFPPVPPEPDPVSFWLHPDGLNMEHYRAAVRRECRGIIFCSRTGNILRRPYHKFFNLGEREECLPDNLDFTREHMIMDKLDGSMIAPFMLHGELRWGTKMGITDIGLEVEKWVRGFENRHYRYMAEAFIKNGVTPIFEWCSPSNQIVLRHKEEKLFLTAMRHMRTGHYIELPETGYGYWDKVDICPVYDGESVQDVQKFIASTRRLTDVEGYVVRFFDGHMVKVKCDWYCNIHKIKDQINSERAVLEMHFANQLDDAIGILPEEDRERVSVFTKSVDDCLRRYAEECARQFLVLRSQGIDRKTFALGPAKEMPSFQKSLFFTVWDHLGETTARVFYEPLLERLKKTLTNKQNYEEMKNEVFSTVNY